MRIAVISVTRRGALLAETLEKRLRAFDVTRYCFEKAPAEGALCFSRIGTLTAELFSEYGALVFVCACGIAVRAIAPLLRSKQTDPAVIVIDEGGNYVIPILSGHLGGANALAKRIAEKTGALAVLTTATDIGGKFSPDSFAKANDLIFSDFAAAKEVASAVLRGETVGLFSDYPCENIPRELSLLREGKIGIRISGDPADKPFEITLSLIPKNIVLGIGCRKDVPYETLRRRVQESLSEAGILPERVCAVATIDRKAEEKAILELCREYRVPLAAYTAEELMRAKGEFSASPFVKSVTGADNVCERSAVMGGNRLVMRKNAGSGVTAAAAEKETRMDFARDLL